MDLKRFIRDVPDFPKPGILFKDITPLLRAPEAFAEVIRLFADRYRTSGLDAVVAVESRGFILGGALARELKVGFVPVRKPGKLPWKAIQESYALEYGTDKLEIHEDALAGGGKALILDDVLATGGTAAATAELVRKAGGSVHEAAFLIDLTFLKGREKLKNTPVYSIIQY
ncbi:MAG TPA: adenine phosphoribosyltransferase [bacterium]|nr:adenine phosphoribosyltransferase [bacterium]